MNLNFSHDLIKIALFIARKHVAFIYEISNRATEIYVHIYTYMYLYLHQKFLNNQSRFSSIEPFVCTLAHVIHKYTSLIV